MKQNFIPANSRFDCLKTSSKIQSGSTDGGSGRDGLLVLDDLNGKYSAD